MCNHIFTPASRSAAFGAGGFYVCAKMYVCVCVVRASKCICRKTFQFARTCERAPTAENSVELIKYSTVARVHTHEYIKYKCIAHLYCCREVVNTVTVEKYTFIEIHLHALDGLTSVAERVAHHPRHMPDSTRIYVKCVVECRLHVAR